MTGVGGERKGKMVPYTSNLQPASTAISRVQNALDHSWEWITRVPLPTEICDAESQQTFTQLLESFEMGYIHTYMLRL